LPLPAQSYDAARLHVVQAGGWCGLLVWAVVYMYMSMEVPHISFCHTHM
jgi:hypothetical protein